MIQDKVWQNYGSAAEDARRFAIFEANLRAAGAGATRAGIFQSQGVNLFSDMTIEELRRSRTGHVRRQGTVTQARNTFIARDAVPHVQTVP